MSAPLNVNPFPLVGHIYIIIECFNKIVINLGSIKRANQVDHNSLKPIPLH